MLIGGGLFVTAVVLIGFLLPPVNNSVFGGISEGITDGLKVFTHQVYQQFKHMFAYKQINPNIGVVFQMTIVIGWSVVRLFRLVRLDKTSLDGVLNSYEAFDLYNMSSLGVAGLIFYLQQGFYRTFAPAMIIVYLSLVTRKDYKYLFSLLLINIIFFSSYMNYIGNYQNVKSDYTEKISQGLRIQAEIEKFIVFDPDANNPWCNTLLIPLDYYDSRLILLPPGIGISYILDTGTFHHLIKSRYILFDALSYESFKDETNLELLTSLPIGNLYQNLDLDCS